MRPTFVLSLDKELIWGSFDHTSPERFADQNPDPRGVVKRLLGLLDEREVQATWAVVGHLFLQSCSPGVGCTSHPNLIRPDFSWHPGDWLAADPGTDRFRDPLWYGDDIVDMILGAQTPQEVGCHSFSHLVYGDPGCSAEAAASDLAACVDAASARGITLRSFVFPRNVEGHHALLREHGFTAYRGNSRKWFTDLPEPSGRVGHFVDHAGGFTPPVALPEERLPGLWNIPDSMLLLHRGGARRLIPLAARVRKAKLGMRRAIEEGKVFHLWFHPFNLATDLEGLSDATAQILDEAVRLRHEGLLDVRTMGDVAALCAGSIIPAGSSAPTPDERHA